MIPNKVGIFFLSLSLVACGHLQNAQDNQQAICKEIKHRMIFNSATSNQNLAIKQRAEMEGLTRSYHEEGCKQ